MAKQCFCGCGRKINRFPIGLRAMNGRGKQVAERLGWVRTLGLLDEHDPTVVEWFEEGDEILAELRAAVHGEIDSRSLSAAKVGYWQRYGRNIERVAVSNGFPPINLWLAAGGRPLVSDEDGDSAGNTESP